MATMWETPPIIKIYEALGAVADGRLEVTGNTAKCYSSSGNKYYDVQYDPEANAIMANDNGSYWKGYLGYPAIAFLLHTGVLEYRPAVAAVFRGIAWKDLNQKYRNDFSKTIEHLFADVESSQRTEIEAYATTLLEEIAKLRLSKLGAPTTPPSGY